MRDLGAPTIQQDDHFALFELAAWAASDLDTILQAPASCTVLRIRPDLAWVIAEPGDMPDWTVGGKGVVVDLSSSRIRLKLRGDAARTLPRIVAVDLTAIGAGGFVFTAIHGMPVTIIAVREGYDLLVPRSFSASLMDWIEDACRAT